MSSTLSVTIITKNEEACIRECLEAVRFADEIIVLDSGSTDRTVQICREFTDKVYETDWPGFGPQKNRALQYATCDWILSIDADEIVTQKLREQITQAINCDEYVGYTIPRLSIFCGKAIHFGAWRGRPIERLVKRGHGKFEDVAVHENLLIDGKTGALTADLMHDTYTSLEDMLAKMDRYSTLKAKMMFEKNKKGGVFPAITHGIWAFLSSFVFKRGFLDGREGFLVAMANAHYSFYCYLKLMYLQQNEPVEP